MVVGATYAIRALQNKDMIQGCQLKVLFSNNTNNTIRMYTSRALSGHTFRVRWTVHDLEVFLV